MNHMSLFNGIGGFQLAAHWVGWNNVVHVEIDKFCNWVISQIFPDSICEHDIIYFDGRKYKNTIDIISGGDPCQPHSFAGLGKGQNDVRYLWPEYLRIANEVESPWIVNENVVGSVANGILDIKINDLENSGYSCQAYNIPAEAVGALHQRERIWLVAHNPNFDRNNKESRKISKTEKQKEKPETKQYKIHIPWEPVDLRVSSADPNIERLEEFHLSCISGIKPKGISRYFGFGPNAHGDISGDTIKSSIIRMLNGLPEGMDYTERNKRIKALGNAIIPQIAYEIFKAIEEYEKTRKM